MNRIWLLFAATTSLYFVAGNEADNDLWVHLLLGRRILSTGTFPRVDDLSFTAAGSPWVDHEWLAQVLFATVFDGLGSSGLWLLKIALGMASAWLLWRSFRSTDAPIPLRAFVLVLTVAAMARGMAMRPQLFTYVFVPALLLWLDSTDNRAPAMRPAAAVVALWLCAWSNLHGAFIVGLGILGLWAVSPPWQDLPRKLALPAVGLAAACINPYGPSLFTYIWGELSVPHPLTEWQPVRFGDPAQWPFWAMLIATALTLPFARLLRRSPWRAALVIGTAFLALRHQRHVPLFAICAAAPLADQLAAALGRARRLELSEGAARVVAAAVLVMAIFQIGALAVRTVGDRGAIVYRAEEYPVGATQFIKEHALEGNLALPLDWGAYALWHLSPAVKVSMDGRFATVYPPSVVELNFDFFGGVDDRLLEQHRPDYVLNIANFAMRSLPDHGYRPLYRDEVAVLYARPGPASPTQGKAPSGLLPFP
jgi:hypothetical protein